MTLRSLFKVILVSFMFAGSAMAADVKIAVVDMNAAVMQTTKAQSMTEQLKKDVVKDNEKLKKLESEIKELNDKGMKSGKSMPKADQQKLIKQIQEKTQEHNQIYKKIEQLEKSKMKELSDLVKPKIKDVMKEVATKGSYTIVIDMSAAPYYGDTTDVTKEVTDKLNQALK